MTISEIKSLDRRELANLFSKITSSGLREILNNENLGGGISSWKKEMLIEVIFDLVDGIKSELVSKLKPKRNRSNNKEKDKNVKDKTKYNKYKKENPYKYNTEEYYEWEYNKIDSIMMKKEELESPKNLYEEMQKEIHVMINGSFGDRVSQGHFFVNIQHMRGLDAKKTYRKLVKYYHPDNLETGDNEKFIVVDLAWKEYLKYEDADIF